MTNSATFVLRLSGFVVAVLFFTNTSKLHAFPEMTRHSYASCTACHVSPNGGGLLTPYGRNLSRDMLSTWGAEREGEILHGALPKKYMEDLEGSKFRFGGDARSVQTHRENKVARVGQFFFMQAEVEAAYDQGAFAIVMSVGKVEDPRGKGNFTFNSQRYYALARYGDSLNFRVGRFNTAFGINFADHTLSIRRPLGLGIEVERENAELSWLGEKDQAFVSFMKTAAATAETDREQAAVFRYDRIVNERSRVGASFWQGDGGTSGTDSKFTRFIVALHSIVNISEKWFATAEIDRQERLDKKLLGESRAQSQYGFLRLNYEPVQGLWPLAQFQHERGDVNLNSTEVNKYGLGVNFFPRPHFEIFGIWNRVFKQSEWSDEAYVMLHYYL